MSWQTDIRKIVNGFIADLSVKDGMSELVDLTSSHPELHQQYLKSMETAIHAAESSDPEVVQILSDSYGHRVENCAQARQFFQRILDEYIGQYDTAVKE